MSALDQIKGNKTVILAVLAAVIALAAYLFIVQSGKETESEEVISKRVRLEVVEEPAVGQTEDQATSEPQGAIGVPEPEAAGDSGSAQRPETAADRAGAVKDEHKAQSPAKPVIPAQEPKEKAIASKHMATRDEVAEAPSAPKTAPEKKVVEKKPVKHAVKEKAEDADAGRDEIVPEETVKKPSKKSAKASKAVTSADVSARPWVVGLASFKTLGEAQDVTGSLKAMHHNAYITETVKDGRKWYRVRVGFYATKEEAEKVGKSLSAKFGFKNLWVVKPAKAEAKAHFK